MAAPDQKHNERKALTIIPRRIHCAATDEPEPDTDYQKELDENDINNFINTLAEMATAVATRRLAKKRDAA